MKEKFKLEKGKFVYLKKEAAVFGIVLLAVLWRIACAANHFTHYDDVGLIASILQNGESLWDRLHYNSVMHWTYAPLQCWMIGLLVDSGYSYEVNLFLGRLPSLLFSIMNIFLVAVLMKKRYSNNGKKYFPVKLAAVFMISISWELVIYAAQSQPYSIGLTGLLLLMLEFYHTAESKKINKIRLILTGAIVGYMQYQLFIFVFCFYLSIFILLLKDKKNLITSILCSIASFVLELPVIVYFFKSGMLERGTNWNVGIEWQFLFQGNHYRGIEKAKYFLSYFTNNLKIWFQNMFIYKDSNWYTDFLAMCLIAAAIMGLIYTIRTKDKMNLFLLSSMFLFLIMILNGKLAFSPSRHTIIFVPVAIYYVTASIPFFQQLKPGKFILPCMFFCYAAIFMITAITFRPEWELRKNRIGTDVIEEWVEKENPIFIGSYGGVFDLELFHPDGYEQVYAGIWKTGETLDIGDVMILYSRAETINENELAVFDGYLSGKHLELMDATEILLDAEVEYAHNVFSNYGNGFYKYSYRVAE